MTRRSYIQVNGVLYEKGTEPTAERVAPDVMPDIEPYVSQIDGSLINSRSQHRAHLKAHGFEEVGNDSSLSHRPPALPDCNPQGRKELIRTQVASMTHDEWNRAVKRDLDNLRWNSRKD